MARKKRRIAKKSPTYTEQPQVIAAVRGVRLKTVSFFTIGFAFACLAAFLAGRPQMPPRQWSTQRSTRFVASGATQPAAEMGSRNNDARAGWRGLIGGKRKA